MLIGAAFFAFFTALVFIYFIFVVLFVRERYIDRIQELDPTRRVVEEKINEKKEKKSMLTGLAKIVPKKKNGKMSQKLIQANLSLTSEELFIYKLLFSSALGFMIYALSKQIPFMILTFLIVWLVPNLYINSRIKNRRKDFNDQLTGGLNLISNALKAGHSFMQALGIAAKETEGVFSEEFRIVIKEMNFGIPSNIAFDNLLSRIESQDMQLVVNAILIQNEIGGNLSEILENISETIRDRQKLKNEMNALTAQGKLTGTIIVLLPVFIMGILYLLNKEYITVLFTSPIGLGLLGFAFVNEMIGIMFIRKIISIEL